MSPLWKKVYRDVKSNWGQFLAVIVVIALGSAFFIASFSSYHGVQDSLQQTYKEFNFANYWLVLDGDGPPSLPAGAELRDISQVGLQLKDGTKAGAQVIGLPTGGSVCNRLKLIEGSLPGEGQVLVESGFAGFHGLKVGDTISVNSGERIYTWAVSGIARSPEYIWPVVDRFMPVPSPRSFGVLYIPERQLIRDLPVNKHEIVMSGSNISGLMATLNSQGIKIRDVYSRSTQPSNQVLNMMLQGFAEITAVLPWLFLLSTALATFALTSVLSKAQKRQITILQYLGFTRMRIALHYLSYALMAGIFGSALGSIAGIVLAHQLTNALAGAIGLPLVVTEIRWEVIVAAALCCVIAAVMGGLAPAVSQNRQEEHEAGAEWYRFIPVMFRMPLNYIKRDGHNALFSVVVIGLGVGLVIVGLLVYQSVADSARRQFAVYQAYDLRVQFKTALKEDAVSELAQIPGIRDVNPYFTVPVLVQSGQKKVPSLLVGTKGDMLKLENRLGQPQKINGLLLTDNVRRSINARWSPKVVLSAGKSSSFQVKGYVRWPVGNQIFAPLDMAQDFAGKKGISGVYLRVDENKLAEVRAQLYKYPTVLMVDSPQENLSDQEALTRFTYIYLRVMVAFGLLLAAAMLFSTARVNMLARSRDYVTMRVLGLGLGKIALGVGTEYVVLLLGGLILGSMAGVILAWHLLNKVNSLVFYNFLNNPSSVIAFVAVLSLLILPLSIISAVYTISQMDLTENTKDFN